MFAEELQEAVCPRTEVALTWTLTASGSFTQDTRATLVLQFSEVGLIVGGHGAETFHRKRREMKKNESLGYTI